MRLLDFKIVAPHPCPPEHDRMSILVCIFYRQTNSLEPAMQFLSSEYDELWDRFAAKIGFEKPALLVLHDLIEALTERQPGTVMHIVDILLAASPAKFLDRQEQWVLDMIDVIVSPAYLSSLGTTRGFLG